MQRAKLVLVLLLVALGITACGEKSSFLNGTPLQIAEEILKGQDDSPPVTWITPQDDIFSSYLMENYGLDDSTWEDGAVGYAEGIHANEVAIIKLKNDANMEAAQNALTNYIQNRINSFNGYAPKEAVLLKQATIAIHGQYLALLICQDIPSAQAAFEHAFSAEDCSTSSAGNVIIPSASPANDPEDNVQYDAQGYIIFEPPNRMDMSLYDTAPILSAYTTGDTSNLSSRDCEIYEICVSVIENTITDDMTDYQKELLIHDWIVDWADYDDSIFTRQASCSNENDITPYGLLVNHKATCMGYANTFQLFMDLLNIECITVVGATYYNTQDHAWNMVSLDSEWYCVDVTWDDPADNDPDIVPAPSVVDLVTHRYFNLTSSQMRTNYHQWDYDLVPETTATKYKWNPSAGDD